MLQMASISMIADLQSPIWNKITTTYQKATNLFATLLHRNMFDKGKRT